MAVAGALRGPIVVGAVAAVKVWRTTDIGDAILNSGDALLERQSFADLAAVGRGPRAGIAWGETRGLADAELRRLGLVGS